MFKDRKDKNHLIVSLVKSGMRIIGLLTIVFTDLWFLGVALIMAEFLGIFEEYAD